MRLNQHSAKATVTGLQVVTVTIVAILVGLAAIAALTARWVVDSHYPRVGVSIIAAMVVMVVGVVRPADLVHAD